MRDLLLICAMLAFAVSVSAQSPQPCPSVSVENWNMVDRTDQPIVFSARVKNDAVSGQRLQYKWQVSAGTIIAGQNTSSITVNIAGLGGRSVTASVQIVGLKDPCSTASGTVRVMEEPPHAAVYDRYGDIRLRDDHMRLDNFAIVLKKNPELKGLIIVHAGNPTYKGEAADRLRRSKQYLVNVRGVDPKRLVAVDAGYREALTTHLFIVPPGASLPELDSMIPLADIKFTKPKPTPQGRRSRRRT